MRFSNEVLKFLKDNNDSYISGEEISNKLGVTRASIWKIINELKQEGYDVESSSRKGYKLISSPDILTYEEIKNTLNTKYIGRKIVHFDSLDSTNIKAKELAQAGEQEGTVVISEEQKNGRGRLGRQWVSPKFKGIWMSVILTPDVEPMSVAKITLVGAAAVFKALESLGIQSKIKWPNDIIVNNKKISGILTEMSCELNRINYVVMGIGINVNIQDSEFLEELKDKAGSLLSITGIKYDRREITALILNNIETMYEDFLKGDMKEPIEICKENSTLLNNEVYILDRGKKRRVKAVDIDDNGILIVQNEDGKLEGVVSGEVSIRGIMGYV